MTTMSAWRPAIAVYLFLSVSVAATAEDITLTTYYPSPRGVYNELRTTNNAYLASLTGSVGIGTATVPGGGKFAVAGTGQDPVGGVCPSGTDWYDDNGNGTLDNGECKPTGLYVAAAGNVGIGTTGPEVKLHIKQAAVGTAAGDRPASLYLGSNDNGNLRGMLGWSGSPPYFLIQGVEDAVAWRNVVLARDGGNVGIGAAGPNAALTVDAQGPDTTWNTAAFHKAAIGPNWSHIHWGPTGDWYIRSANSTGKVILQDSGGNVGIGTTSPAAKLEVNMQNPAGWSGPLDALDITAPDTRFLMNLRTEVVGGGNVGYRIQTRDAGGVLHDAMTLDSFGNVGIGTRTPQTAAAPNGVATGNLDVNDVWLRSAHSNGGGWASRAIGVSRAPVSLSPFYVDGCRQVESGVVLWEVTTSPMTVYCVATYGSDADGSGTSTAQSFCKGGNDFVLSGGCEARDISGHPIPLIRRSIKATNDESWLCEVKNIAVGGATPLNKLQAIAQVHCLAQ